MWRGHNGHFEKVLLECRRTLALLWLSPKMSLSSLSLDSKPRFAVGGPCHRRYPLPLHPRSFLPCSPKRPTVSASLSVTADSTTTEQPLGRIGSLSQVSGVLGCQWGDEGKGKLVDILAQHFDIVARCQVKSSHLYPQILCDPFVNLRESQTLVLKVVNFV